jgi:hypothetical protein
MLLIAIGNGILRELFIKKLVTDHAAHQLSTITLIIFFALYVGYVISHYPPASALQAISIGIFWLVLTLLFEFGFGYYRGNTWNAMLSEYNILEGKLWILVPLWVAAAPWVFFKLRGQN